MFYLIRIASDGFERHRMIVAFDFCPGRKGRFWIWFEGENAPKLLDQDGKVIIKLDGHELLAFDYGAP